MNHNNIKDLLRQGYRYAYSLTHNTAQAEDLVQDAWLLILKKAAPQNAPYLIVVIRNCFLNQLKRDKIVPLVTIEDIQSEELLVSNEQDFVRVLADRNQLNKALESLRCIEREVIYLYYIEEYTTQEIANLTEMTKGVVCSLIHRARIKLKKSIDSESKVVAL